ncbi:MAG TPA: hypothetical protein VNE42_04575, partial [Acidimicrobiales bacterium]|nr:hypothetical protein [Acidimicrobiales bacterium]
PLRAAPTVIDLSVTGHGHANDHVRRVLPRTLARASLVRCALSMRASAMPTVVAVPLTAELLTL